MIKNKGFTILEMAIVLVIIGVLSSGGISIIRVTQDNKMRNESLDYLKSCKESLLAFSNMQGRLPFAAQLQNGIQTNNLYQGWFPYITVGFQPRDKYSRVLKYVLNGALINNQVTNCNNIKAGLVGQPLIVDIDGSNLPLTVAVVLISSGNNNSFDSVNTGSHTGNNNIGVPNYIRSFPSSVYDDLTIYITGTELYNALKCF